MKIAIGGIVHETNTMFGPPTPVEEFQRQIWGSGEDIIGWYQCAGLDGVLPENLPRDYVGGMLSAARRYAVEIFPTFLANAHPSGTIQRVAFEQMLGELLSGLQNGTDLDAVCLSLHGAGSAEGVDDIEGTILEAVRDFVGSDLPVIATLDLHCHMTDRMIENATALLDVHEYPHVDCFERGFESVELAVRVIKGEVSPVMHLIKLPMMIPPTTTFHGPGYQVKKRCFEWERKELLDVTFGHGYPHTDVPMIASSVLAIADGDEPLAQRAAEDVAQYVWNIREEFRVDFPEAAEAVQQAINMDARPVVIAEVSDNPGGGAPGDGTHLLRALLEANRPETVFGFLVDPVTADQAHRAKPGARIEVKLGGLTDPDILGEPIEASAYVKAVTDGRFVIQSDMGGGGIQEMGKMARLLIGHVDVIIGSESFQTIDAELFLLHGIDVSRYKIVALKSQNHFFSGFKSIAGDIIRTDPPGWTPGVLEKLDYKRLKRPIWPLDDGITWQC
ncbi:MAG: MlrC domain protein [Dehalococcoidales bacterium]|nr:MlrC domain protein [Dehalococcoidales bacterium]